MNPRAPAAALVALWAAAVVAAPITLRHALDDAPLDVPREDVPPAVEQFHETGENPFLGDPGAVAEGQDLWAQWCQACHLADASGRIGTSLVHDRYNYERSDTQVGQLEIVYGGAGGAMQAFGDRLSQEEILNVLACVESLGNGE